MYTYIFTQTYTDSMQLQTNPPTEKRTQPKTNNNTPIRTIHPHMLTFNLCFDKSVQSSDSLVVPDLDSRDSILLQQFISMGHGMNNQHRHGRHSVCLFRIRMTCCQIHDTFCPDIGTALGSLFGLSKMQPYLTPNVSNIYFFSMSISATVAGLMES